MLQNLSHGGCDCIKISYEQLKKEASPQKVETSLIMDAWGSRLRLNYQNLTLVCLDSLCCDYVT